MAKLSNSKSFCKIVINENLIWQFSDKFLHSGCTVKIVGGNSDCQRENSFSCKDKGEG